MVAGTVGALIVALLALPTLPAKAIATPDGLSPSGGETVAAQPVLTWTDVIDAHVYEVQVSVDDTFASASQRYRAEVADNRVVLPRDLAPGTYFWRVRPYDGDDVAGTFSAVSTFVRDTPNTPTLTAPEDNAQLDYPSEPPILRWDPMAGAKSYQVQWSTNRNFLSGNGETVVTDTSVTSSFALDSLLSPERDYYWRVRANYPVAKTTSSTEDRATEFSAYRKFRLNWNAQQTTPVLHEPADSSAVDNAIDSPTFRWSPVPGASKYRIQVSSSPTLLNPIIDTDVSRVSYAPFGALDPGAYYWRVAVVDADGNRGPWSDTWEFYRQWLDSADEVARPAIVTGDVNAADGLQMTMARDQILIEWAPIPSASHYEIQFSTDPTFLNSTTAVRATCKTPNTAITPINSGGYAATSKLSTCNVLKSGTTFDLWDDPTVYVRVRAIDKSVSNAEIASLWSDQARPGGVAPGPVAVTLTDPSATGTSSSVPATQSAPAIGAVSTANPVLSWERVAGTTADTKYLVAMSKSESFNQNILTSPHIVTANTRLVLAEELLDSQAGESYYWYVLPCHIYTAQEQRCSVSDSDAISQDGRWRSFRKVTPEVQDLASVELPGAGATGVALSWAEQVAAERGLSGADSSTLYNTGGTRHYRVEVSTDPGFVNAGKQVAEDEVDGTNFVPQFKLNPTETYYWRVRAMDGAGTYLSWGETAQFTPNSMAAPAQTGTLGSGSMQSLKWSPTHGAKKYDVELYRGTDPTFPAANLVAGYPISSEFTAVTPSAQLAAGTYSWRVRATDHYAVGGSWATAPDPYVVGAQQAGLTSPANEAIVGLPDLAFDWDAVSGASEYAVQVSTASDFSSVYDTITTNATEAVPTKDGGYAAGAYYWRVLARSTTGVLSTSTARELTVRTRPAQTTSVRATASTSQRGTVDVTWTAPANTGGTALTGYRMWVQEGSGEWQEQTPLEGAHGGRSLTGLADATAYKIKVAAMNAVGTGRHSTAATVTTGTLPGTPASPRISPALGGFEATWSRVTATPAVTGYEYRHRSQGGTWTNGQSGTPSVTVANLPGNTVHEFEVRAVNDAGPGPWASVTPFTTLAAPSEPLGVTATAGPKSGVISWSAPADQGSSPVTAYVVKYRPAGGAWTTKTTSTAPYTASSLTAGTTYEVVVAAKNSAGTGADSALVTFVPTVPPTTSSPSPTQTTPPPASNPPKASPPGAPGKPSGKGKGSGKKRKVTVTWTPATGSPTGYTLERSLNKSKWTPLSTSATTAKFKSKKGKTYYVRVKATNAAGAGPYSAIATMKG